MKKIFAALLVFCVIFSFSACKTEQTTEPDLISEATHPAFAEAGTTPTVYAVVSNENPTIGEEVTITVKLCNAGLLASVDLIAEYDSNALKIEHTAGSTIPEVVDMLKIDEGTITYGGFVMKSASVADETMFVLTVTPLTGAAGTQTIQLKPVNFLVAKDETGNETDDMTLQLQTKDIVLNIQ